MEWLIALAVIITPAIVVVAEAVTGIRARLRSFRPSGKTCHDFQILVPIWGNIKYLENIEYLSQYGSQVTLCTTGDEMDTFYADLESLSLKYGFQIYKDAPKVDLTKLNPAGKRATSGAMRDTIIRNALQTVSAPFVVALDADSTTVEHISLLVGDLEQRKLDIASVRILPRNQTSSLLARLQTFEYELAMNFRFLCPWLVSGACHAAKTEVLKDIMERHSLFFQGNDVETGLIAKSLGYRIGHIPFEVLTTVPDSFKAWFRQRLAWCGGEFRLYIMNFKFILKHPLFWFYGAVIMICLFPLRIYAFANPGLSLLIVFLIYLALVIYLHRQRITIWLFLLPFYTLFGSLIMVPLGIYWYFRMARQDKNYGIIRVNKNSRTKAHKLRHLSGITSAFKLSLVTLPILAFLFFTYQYSGKDMNIVLATANGIKNSPATFPENMEIGAYMWEAPGDYSATYLQDAFASSQKEGINAVYLRIDDVLDILEMGQKNDREPLLKNFDKALKNFIRIANQYEIKVYGLAGHEKWANEGYEYIPCVLAKYVGRFNEGSLPEERLAGIRFDIESYSQKGFAQAENQKKILTDFISMTDKLATCVNANSPDLVVGITVPYWLDNVTRELPKITYGGKPLPAVFHVIDNLNKIEHGYLVVMAYRNEPFGVNGTIALAKEELGYAQKTGVKVLVAQEMREGESANDSFYNAGNGKVKSAAHAIADHYAHNPAFGGIAIHDLEGYRKLPNKPASWVSL